MWTTAILAFFPIRTRTKNPGKTNLNNKLTLFEEMMNTNYQCKGG